ncbi:MAG: biotin/lipoyl-binding protein, partial [Saprospiraceae bacterium]
MKNLLNISIYLYLFSAFISCKEEAKFDASGAFEADEIIISAEATGNIKLLNIEEGQQLKSGEIIGYVDSIQLYLKRKQLQAQLKASGTRRPNIKNQTSVYSAQEAQTQSRLD